MRVSGRLQSVAARALAESMDVHTMTILARRLFGDYDLYQRTGYPKNFAIPNKNAAAQIVRDIRESGHFIDFIGLLIQLHENGLKGRKYRIPYLREMVGELKKEGLIYDGEMRIFFEDPSLKRTRNWGVLRNGSEYIFAFLLLDIVGNTKLVRRNTEEEVQKTYRYLREMVRGIVESRNGRVWNWEGDGGIAAFYFSNKENHAVLCSMEIITELYLYNLVQCRLHEPLSVRMAVHSGPCEYRSDYEEIVSDTIDAVEYLESKLTRQDSVTISDIVYRQLSPLIVTQLEPLGDDAGSNCFRYELRWEN